MADAEAPRIDLSKSRTRWTPGMLVRRALWEFLFMPLVAWSPKWCGFFRKAVLRLFGAQIGPKCIVSSGVRVLMPWNLRMGSNSWIGWDVDIYNYAPVTLGDNCVVSQYTYLCTASHDHTASDFPLIYSPIAIGDQAWVAAKCIVGPGVVIGAGAVVGSGSVVFKDVPEWTICAGNPCRTLKPRELKGAGAP
jgi:putative colanic acid biosynthesis acetyltransferase WcaF